MFDKKSSAPSPGGSGAFAGDVLKLVSGTAFAQTLAVLVSPILTRLYAPEAFGVLALFVSIASILGMVSCLRYEMAIPLPESDGDAASLLVVCLCFVAVTTGVTAGIIIWRGHDIVHWLNAPGLYSMRWWMPLYVFLMGVSLAFSYWNTRMKQFGRISRSHIANSLSAHAIKLGAGFAGWVTGTTLIAATLVGQMIAVLLLGSRIWRIEGALIRSHGRRASVWEQIRRYRKFPLADIWGALLNNASWHIPSVLFAIYFSPAIVGLYALAFRLLQMPMLLIGTSLGQVFYQRAAQTRVRGEPMALLTEEVFRRLVVLGLFPTLILAVAGPDLFAVVFGDRWRDAGVYTQILSVWIFWWFISSPISLIFMVLERQGLILIFHVAIFATRLLSIVIGGVNGDVFLALWLFAGSGCVVYGLLTLQVLKLSGISWIRGLRAARDPVLYGLPLALAVLATKSAWSPSGVMVLIVSTMALFVYFAIAIRRDQELCRMLLARVKAVR